MTPSRAPTGIRPLALLGLAFLVLPLVALALRTPWGEAGALVRSPVVVDALIDRVVHLVDFLLLGRGRPGAAMLWLLFVGLGTFRRRRCPRHFKPRLRRTRRRSAAA